MNNKNKLFFKPKSFSAYILSYSQSGNLIVFYVIFPALNVRSCKTNLHKQTRHPHLLISPIGRLLATTNPNFRKNLSSIKAEVLQVEIDDVTGGAIQSRGPKTRYVDNPPPMPFQFQFSVCSNLESATAEWWSLVRSYSAKGCFIKRQ